MDFFNRIGQAFDNYILRPMGLRPLNLEEKETRDCALKATMADFLLPGRSERTDKKENRVMDNYRDNYLTCRDLALGAKILEKSKGAPINKTWSPQAPKIPTTK